MNSPVLSGSQKRPEERPLLDRRLPLTLRVLILLVLSVVPTGYVIKHYNVSTQFTGLIFFGSLFQDRALPEIRAMPPALSPDYGYDGQFYAQIALDPLLRHPEFSTALDNPGYRSQRIFLPLLAYVLGFGRQNLVLNIYAVLNLIFWFFLLGGFVYFLAASTSRDYLCIIAMVWSTGCLISIERALTDLPATTLGFYATVMSGAPALVLLSLGILTKPSTGLFLLQYAWPVPQNRGEILAWLGRMVFVLAGPVLWLGYLVSVFGSTGGSGENFNYPFHDWFVYFCLDAKALIAQHHTLIAQYQSLVERQQWLLAHQQWFGRHLRWDMTHTPRPSLAAYYYSNFPSQKLFEFLALFSLMVQACFFVVSRDLACPYWRIGAGFALLFVCLSSSVFIEQIAFTRSVLPMTLAFNIRLMKVKGFSFFSFYLLGNGGLAWAWIDIIENTFGL